MFDTKPQHSYHHQQKQNPSPPSTSRLQEHNFMPTASNSQFTGMANYGMAEYSSPPINATVPSMSTPAARVRFVEGIPKHQQVIFPVNEGNTQFGHAIHEIPGPSNQATNSYPSSHHTRSFDPPMAEDLRGLAKYYVHHPDSHVNAVCTEHTSAYRYKVTISLEVGDIILRDPSSFRRDSLSSPQEESA